ncbi:hypothetical protein RFI_26127 [Reticulomyxa filosa]|uniref:Uncharacterized protein n=1 Tax=Reticulomyxa filosa TaxID=46433 RepID=X6MDY3_RETFI|nr:hypothetical protein RFI_26127 [Reticulomyxa filosa]|eukprot:ETO11250.1 hypothetical protein RFI_26127 [Reticulomyxa filosa]
MGKHVLQLVSKAYFDPTLLSTSAVKKIQKQLRWAHFPPIQYSLHERFEHRTGDGFYYIGSEQQYPRLACDNIVKFVTNVLNEHFSAENFQFSRDLLSKHNIDAWTTFDCYPFPRTFPKQKECSGSSTKIKHRQQKMEWKLERYEHFKVGKEKYVFIPILKRKTKTGTQELMIWPDCHPDLDNIHALQTICHSYRPDILTFEGGPDISRLPMFSHPRLASGVNSLFKGLATWTKIIPDGLRLQLGRTLLHASPTVAFASVGVIAMLDYAARHKLPFVILDLPSFISSPLSLFCQYLDAYHFAAVLPMIGKTRFQWQSFCSNPSKIPHTLALCEFRNAYLSIGINECDPHKYPKILALMGSAHVRGVVGLLTGERALWNPIKAVSGTQVVLHWGCIELLNAQPEII